MDCIRKVTYTATFFSPFEQSQENGKAKKGCPLHEQPRFFLWVAINKGRASRGLADRYPLFAKS